MPETPIPDLPTEVWSMIAGHCVNVTHGRNTPSGAAFLPQPHLARLMRVSSAIHDVSAPYLYKDVSVIHLPSLLYGVPTHIGDVAPLPEAPDTPIAIGVLNALAKTALGPEQEPNGAVRMDKLALLKLVRRMHIVGVMALEPPHPAKATPDEIAAHAARSAEYARQWREMIDVLSVYPTANLDHSTNPKLLLPALQQLALGMMGRFTHTRHTYELYETNKLASLFIPLTAVSAICDRDSTGILGYYKTGYAPVRPEGVAPLTYIQHIDPDESEPIPLWGAENISIFAPRHSSDMDGYETD